MKMICDKSKCAMSDLLFSLKQLLISHQRGLFSLVSLGRVTGYHIGYCVIRDICGTINVLIMLLTKTYHEVPRLVILIMGLNTDNATKYPDWLYSSWV